MNPLRTIALSAALGVATAAIAAAPAPVTPAAERKQNVESLLAFETNQYAVRVYQQNGAVLVNVYDKVRSTLTYNGVPARKISGSGWLGYVAAQGAGVAYARYNIAGETELELIENGTRAFISDGYDPSGTEYRVETQIAQGSGQPVTVPRGTALRVALDDTVATGLVEEDDRFTAKLATNLIVNGIVIAPRGTLAIGEVTNARAGGRRRARLSLKLTELSANGQLVRLATDEFALEVDRDGAVRRTGGAAVVGMDATDAQENPGGLSLLTSGEQIAVPSSTVLQFELQDEVTVGGSR